MKKTGVQSNESQSAIRLRHVEIELWPFKYLHAPQSQIQKFLSLVKCSIDSSSFDSSDRTA